MANFKFETWNGRVRRIREDQSDSPTAVTKRRNGRPLDINGNERRKPAKAHAQASNAARIHRFTPL